MDSVPRTALELQVSALWTEGARAQITQLYHSEGKIDMGFHV